MSGRLLQIFNFAAAFSAAFLVDRLGRRTLFNWSGIGMLVSFVIWTACSAVFDIDGNKSAGIAVVAFVFIYVSKHPEGISCLHKGVLISPLTVIQFFHYDICYTPLLFGYTTEILPYSLRAKGLTAELLSIYGSLVLLAFVNPIALDNIGWHYYIVFCCLLVVIVLVAWFVFPETKGHSLEEIAEIFDGPRARPMVVDDIMLDNKDTHGEGVGVEHVTKV